MTEPREGLRVRALTVRFGSKAAVDGVDLTVPVGGVTAVLGPSGCGKSTLLRAIAGLETAVSGSVSYDTRDLTRVPAYRRGFALMFQDGQLFAHRSVARNVGYPLEIRRVPSAERAPRVIGLLDLVGLSGYGERMPATLSGGERQRVALARALAVEPRLLLLDEPLSALDRGLRERLATDLHDILRRAGITALLVTHDHEEAFAIADRMAVMREGRLVQQGSLAEVWSGPADAWTARFLGYPAVLDGPAAIRLREVVAPAATWTSVALRRSALRLRGDGPLAGRVLAVRATPEQVRLELRIDGIGDVDGVADPGQAVSVGDDVRVEVAADRIAALP